MVGRGVQSQIYVRIGLEEQSQGKRNQGRQESKAGTKQMRIKCVVNNTHGKEAGKQGRQESKAGAKQAKCVVNNTGGRRGSRNPTISPVT